VVLSVSRLHPEKHGERLVAAAPHVLAARPDATFVIAGDGEERARLEAMALDLGVAARVRFLGAVPNADLPAVYRAADVLVALSDRTNLSNSVLEALCCGLSVVAVDAGGTAKVVRDGETGVLLPRDAVARLPEVLLQVLADDARRTALGHAARDLAAKIIPDVGTRQALEVQVVVEAHREAVGK
jgi:glycosyltransferase involved in cell wall biosynthesis